MEAVVDQQTTAVMLTKAMRDQQTNLRNNHLAVVVEVAVEVAMAFVVIPIVPWSLRIWRTVQQSLTF